MKAWQFVAMGIALSLPQISAYAQTQGAAQPPPRPDFSNKAENTGLRNSGDFDRIHSGESRHAFLLNNPVHAASLSDASNFARCAVRLNEKRARDFLDQARREVKGKPVDPDDFVQRNRGCAIVRTALDPDFLRGSIAEQLLRASDSEPTVPLGVGLEGVQDFIRSIKAPNNDTEDPFTIGQLEGECRVGFAPLQARAVVWTERASEAEVGALEVLRGITPQCDSFVVKGKPLTTEFKRAFLAQAFYHWMATASKG